MGLPTFFFCCCLFFVFFSSAGMFCAHLLWKKQRIGLKFSRTILMGMLQIEVKYGFGAVGTGRKWFG